MKGWTRILAWTAILGGLLRVADNFLPAVTNEAGLQRAYALTDVALILGLIGFFLALRGRLGWLGLGGVALAITGLVAVRIGAAADLNIYQMGAAIALFGTAFLGIEILLKNLPSPVAATLWIGALVLGLAALIPQMGMPAAFAAGIAFALGFVAEGFVLLF